MTAETLAIAGVEPFSSTDWPGKLVATVFAQGCPWACGYCHNQAIIDPAVPGVTPWHDVRDLLARRRGLLDGVVFSGGEPTRQRAVVAAAAEVRERGYGVGVHTGGGYPAMLDELLTYTDWVGLDIKALPEHYDDVVRRPGGGAKAWRSLELIAASGVDVEVRLTMTETSATARHAPEIVRRVREAGVGVVALQEARATGGGPEFQRQLADGPLQPGWFDALANRVEDLTGAGVIRRPA